MSKSISSPQSLELRVAARTVPRFFTLLRQGFWIRTEAGLSLHYVLTSFLGFSRSVVQDRIQTIFLDGYAVDDPERAYPAPGATVALSAAAPGLVGAGLRKGGAFAGLRGSITFSASPSGHQDGAMDLRIRLYNLLAKEWGEVFLTKGIRMEAEELRAVLADMSAEVWAPEGAVRLEGEQLDPKALLQRLGEWSSDALVLLRLTTVSG